MNSGTASIHIRRAALLALCAVALLMSGSCSDNLLRRHIVTHAILAETENVIYVSPNGNDANHGTPEAPKRTINAAIRVFTDNGLTGEIAVAGGVYEVNYYDGTHVVLAEGVSLYGGFDADFSHRLAERDFEANASVIRDTSAGPTTDENHPRAVEAGEQITAATRMNGFTIVGGTGQSAVGVLVEGGSPTIATCVIQGGSPTTEDGSSTWTSGILVRGGGPVITGCDISGSQISDAWYSTGVSIEAANSFEIDSCTVNSGTATGATDAVWIGDGSEGFVAASTLVAEPAAETRGVVVSGSRVNLWDSVVRADSVNGEIAEGVNFDDAAGDIGGNDIRAGHGSVHSMGIVATNGSNPYITHNVIAAGGGGNYSSGIHLEAANAGWIGVGFNTVFGGSGVWTNAIYAGDIRGPIFANLLHGGGVGATGSRGIQAIGGEPAIENNTIYGGNASAVGPEDHAPNSIGISCEPSQPEILSNIIFAGGSGSRVGIAANDDLTGSVAHNLFFSDTGTMSLYGGSVGYEYEGLGSLQTDHPNFENNVTGDPKFAAQDGADNEIDTMDDNDWRLTADTPVEIREGGFVSAEGYLDLDGVPRTDPSSIGAYEYD